MLKKTVILSLIPIALLLVSCKNNTQPSIMPPKLHVDGPPLKGKVVRTKGSKVITPKLEPHSRYGNPDQYHVLGKTYHVLSTSKGFKQRGLASWYGTKFHNKRTSSGETYDMYEMTAAHKTLPLPTYVKVKNLENNREIIVKVNDRGPFHDGRVIDLSYAAAKTLGVLKNGVAKVVLETYKFANNRKHQAALYLQIGAFREYKKAQQYKKFLDGFLIKDKLEVEHKNDIYAVIMGPFKTKKTRLEVKQILIANGINGSFSFFK